MGAFCQTFALPDMIRSLTKDADAMSSMSGIASWRVTDG
jgi:hypothetical protein